MKTDQKPCPTCGGTGKVLDAEKVGARLRAYREKRGVSLRTVAKRMGISANHLSDMETGQRNWNQDRERQFKEAVNAKDQ